LQRKGNNLVSVEWHRKGNGTQPRQSSKDSSRNEEIMLRRPFIAMGLCLVFCLGAKAQDFPKAEVFGGYSFGNFGPVVSGASRTNVNGWNGSLGVNLNRWFGVVSDFSGHYGDFNSTLFLPVLVPPCVPPGCSIQTAGNAKYHNFLFGPQFSFRAKKVTPFAHVLFGGTRTSLSGVTNIILPLPPPPPIPPTFQFSTSTTNFAFAGGGGIDYKFADRIAWRLQMDYLQSGVQSRTLNNIRLSTGVVIHF
jgi:opacity protein-like surface antigen